MPDTAWGAGQRQSPLWRRVAVGLAAHELALWAVAAPLLLLGSRWAPVALLAIALAWMSRWLARGRLTVATPADAPLLVLVAMASIGWWVSPDRAASADALWRLWAGVALFYALANARPLRFLPAGAIVAGLALAALSLLGTDWARVRLFGLPQLYSRLPAWLRDVQDGSPFHPRVMGMALATWLPLPLALLILGRGRSLRSWAALAVAVMGLTLLLCQSIQGLAGLALGVWFLLLCRDRRFLLVAPLGLAALAAVLWAYGPRQAALAALTVGDPLGIAAALRLDMWSRAAAMIGDLPYTGIGLDAFPVLQWQFYPGVMLGAEPHAHNLFLQVALDLGLPGLVAFLSLCVALGWAAARALPHCRESRTRAVLLGAVAAALSYLASGVLDTLWAAKPNVLLWAVLGGIAALSIAETPPAPAAGERWHLRLARAAAWVGVVLLALAPGLLLPAHAWELNLAAVRAHPALLAARGAGSTPATALRPVVDELERVAAVRPDNAHLARLQGEALGWLGDYAGGVAALGRVVELDGRDPLGSYAPFEALRRLVAAEPARDRWEDLLWVYGHWVSRFPQRAEAYICTALVHASRGNVARAAAVLRSGLSNGAQPRGLLQYSLERLPSATAP